MMTTVLGSRRASMVASAVALVVSGLLVTLPVVARSAPGPIFSDDFQTGIDLSRWVLHNPGGGTWIPASEAGNGYVTSPPQSYVLSGDRMDNMMTVRDDFSDFVMTWDARFQTESWHADGRPVYFRTDNSNEPLGYWFMTYVTHPTYGYRHIMFFWALRPGGGADLLSELDYPWELNRWYSFRLKVAGNNFKVKTWLRGDPEPPGWTMEASDPQSFYTQGRIGFGDYWYGVTDADNVVLTGINTVGPEPPATCITPAHACIEVPVTIAREEATPVRGYSVTLQLSAALASCAPGIVEGSYLSGISGTHFEVMNNGGGSYTVDCAILGATCGATAASGTLFTLHLGSSAPSGTGTVTVTSVTMRDCDNGAIAASAGAPVSISIDNGVPDGITLLAASQQKTGNDGDGTTKINLSWPAVEAGTDVEVWRKGFGNYPEYDDAPGAGSAPTLPGSYPPAGWTLAATMSGPITYADEIAARDFWSYVAYVKDACGNVSLVSNLAGGVLNYHLGDTHNGAASCAGDNLVNTSDISYLGAHYGITLAPSSALACLDVGPTTDYSVNARPTTDNKVEFEDLMMFAINHGVVSSPQFAAQRVIVAAATNALRLAVPALPAIGETFAVTVTLESAGEIQGLSLDLAYDPAVVEPVGVEPGALLDQQGAPAMVLSARPGNLDAALLGTGQAIAGAGELARMVFRVKSAGAAAIALDRIEARDIANRPVPLDRPAAVPGVQAPTTTTLLLARPNPFAETTTLSYALATEGPVELAIYAVDGRRVTTLVRETKSSGTYHPVWDGRDERGAAVKPGLYYVRLITAAGRFTRTLVLMK